MKRRVSRQATLWSRLRTSRVPLGRTAFVQRGPDLRKGSSSSILRTSTRGFSSWRSLRLGARIGFRCGRRPRWALRGGDLCETNPIRATTTRTASDLQKRSYGKSGLPEATGEQSQIYRLRIADFGLQIEEGRVWRVVRRNPISASMPIRRSAVPGANRAKQTQSAENRGPDWCLVDTSCSVAGHVSQRRDMAPFARIVDGG